MTQIVKKNAPKTIEGSQDRLLASTPENDEILEQMETLKLYISGDKLETGGYMVPRFGLLSLKMRNTPMYAYDHPAFLKLSNTAFTDGVHVFIAKPFLEQLNKEEDDTKGMEQGAVPLILHELMHMLKNHTRRLTQFPKDVANEAEDLSINAQLQIGFPEIRWVPSLREVGLSFREGDVETYAKLAEETIARQLMEKRKEDKKECDGKGNGKGKGKGKGSPSSSGAPGEQGEGEGEQDQDQDQEWDNDHTHTLEEVIDTINENGLKDVLDKLELPESSSDVEKIGQIEEQVRMKDIDAIQKAAAQKAQMGGKYPGGHIVDSCAELVKGFTEGKLRWKLGLKSFIFGGGMRFRYTESEPGDLYFVDPKEMGLNTEIYVGSDLPHKPEEIVLCLIDTSGSVDTGQLKAFLSEIFGLKKENSGIGDSASEIVVIAADTVVRGDATIITEDNVDEVMASGVGLGGRGGTDLGNDLRQTMALEIFKEKKISSVLFFTDLCDSPPKKSDFPSDLPLCFITMPHTMSDEFARAVKDFARVYPIEDGLEVDLTQDHLATPVNTRKTKA